jgi:hypothetical protein
LVSAGVVNLDRLWQDVLRDADAVRGDMPDIALYYPYTFVRDDEWLKASALYMHKLALVAPRQLPRFETATAMVLRDELDFLVDVDPASAARRIGEEFLRLVDRDREALRSRYAWSAEFPPTLTANPEFCIGRRPIDDGLVGWVHMRKTGRRLTDAMVRAGLAVLSPNRSWLGMHPRLAAVYLTALADSVAQANKLPVVTDQEQAYGVLGGWDIDVLARVLLTDEADEQSQDRPPTDVARLYATAAIQTVAPQRLGSVSASEIVRIRRTLAEEFDVFGQHIDSVADELAGWEQIDDPGVLQERLQVLVDRNLGRPLADLERGMRKLRYEPARAVLGLMSVGVPATAVAAVVGLGLPAVVGQAGLIATRIVVAGVRAHETARGLRRSAPGYLLGLREELNPVGVVDRIRRTIRRAARSSATTQGLGRAGR